MNKHLESKLVEVIDTLASKMGVASEFIWTALKTQAIVEVVYWVVMTMFAVTAWVVFIKLFKRCYDVIGTRKTYGDSEDILRCEKEVSSVAFTIILGLLASFLTIGVIFNSSSPLTALINPDYWALQEILKQL